MTRKRAENVLEVRAYIKGRSLLGMKAVYIVIHRELCDIYGKSHMSHRTVYRWVAKFSAGQRVTMQKKNLKMYPKYSKKAFENIVYNGDETWVYYFEPKRKVANRIWATKNCQTPKYC